MRNLALEIFKAAKKLNPPFLKEILVNRYYFCILVDKSKS